MLFSKLIISIVLTIVTLGALGSAFAHSGAKGIVKERMDLFSQNKDNLKAIKSYLGSSDLKSVVPLAREIRDWAQRIPEYFPEGSDGKPSEASPEIWLNFEGFKKSAFANRDAANELMSAAAEGDKSATIKAFKATASTCKSCHKSFRLD
jgi:cytochrome c556